MFTPTGFRKGVCLTVIALFGHSTLASDSEWIAGDLGFGQAVGYLWTWSDTSVINPGASQVFSHIWAYCGRHEDNELQDYDIQSAPASDGWVGCNTASLEMQENSGYTALSGHWITGPYGNEYDPNDRKDCGAMLSGGEIVCSE